MTICPMVSSGGPERERRDELTLAALPSAVPLVGLLVQHDLADWLFDGGFIRRVERVAEVLARHAVATTGITKDAPFYSEVFDDLCVIVVRLRVFGERVIVEMWDQDNVAPDASLEQKLAAAGSEAWGYEFPLPGYRVVWCALWVERPFSCRAPEAIEHPAPAAAAAAADPGFDTGFLHRVLDGLRRHEPTERFDGDEPAP